MSKICLIGVVLVLAASAQTASQLAPRYQAIANNLQAAEAMPAVDLSKADVSVEVPAMITAIQSGNQAVMNAAVGYAITMLQIHKMDAENPNFRKLKPPLPEVIKEFQRLPPVLVAHFADPGPQHRSAQEKFAQAPWKTDVVQFLDLIGGAPTPEMLTWMLEVMEWPNGPAQEYVARIENESKSIPNSDLSATHHDSILRDTIESLRAYTLKVAPVLAHLNPMPQMVTDALMRKIGDSKESLVATAIIRALAENKATPVQVVDLLVAKALDQEAPVDVRVAAIYAIAKLRPNDLSQLSGLRGVADDRIARALIDTGVR